MHRPRFTVLALLAPALMATGLLVTACSSQPEQPILQQFFTASRLRDNQTLANFSAVSLDPQTQGSVSSFSITNVSAVQSEPLMLKDLAQKRDEAKAADDAFTKKKLAYQNDHIDAIQRVLKAEAGDGRIARRDEDVKKAWDEWRQQTADSAKAASDSQQALNDVSGIAQLSVNGARSQNPIRIDQVQRPGDVEGRDGLDQHEAAVRPVEADEHRRHDEEGDAQRRRRETDRGALGHHRLQDQLVRFRLTQSARPAGAGFGARGHRALSFAPPPASFRPVPVSRTSPAASCGLHH